MSEAICVCGHNRDDHMDSVWMEDGQVVEKTYGTCRKCVLNCQDFRPILDWPDSEGDWRIDCKWKWPLLSLCYFDAKAQLVWMIGRGHGFTQPMFESAFGPAKFVRLLEPNPFQPDPARAREV